VICEIQNHDGSMARLPQLVAYARRHGLRLISIADLIGYRLDTERFVRRQAEAKLPSAFGNFRAIGYRNELDGSEHVAIVKGHPEQAAAAVLVRVHSECLTGDAFGSLRCDCRPQLEAALQLIEQAGEGVVVYLRQEGRGIGLVNKLKAYSLQDGGLDTVEANEHLGFAADLRNYGVGAQILSDLGIQRLRLITNNPRKIAGLGGYGLEVVDRVPLVMDPGDHNAAYLQAKRLKLGHLLGEPTGATSPVAPSQQDAPQGLTAVLAWDGAVSPTAQVERLEVLRQWAHKRQLLIHQEEHPRLLALLEQPRIAMLLEARENHQLTAADLAGSLKVMAQWSDTTSVALLLAPDSQRRGHPSGNLEPERRGLGDLGPTPDAAVCPWLNLKAGSFIRWS
jgi:3,4-dihydroxy 2-butanone 4-phosphate synthase/GTP cyclohydrolase II